MTYTRRPSADDGSIALETLIIAPVLFLLLGLVVAFARVQLATSVADSAAQAAARQASLIRDPGAAQAKAEKAALDSLAGSGVHCSQVSVQIDTSGLAAPVGQAASVQATVSCTAPLGDIGLPGLPGSKTLTSHFTSVVDRFRAR